MSATISKIPATSAGNGIDVICDKDRVSTVLFYDVNVECRSFGVTIMIYSSNFNVRTGVKRLTMYESCKKRI